MLRYYMTPETQQALIAESNRVIASRSLTRHSGNGRGRRDGGETSDFATPGSEPGTDPEGAGQDSAFAKLVSDLQSASAVARNQ